MTVRPQPSNPLMSRVTTVALWDRATEAIQEIDCRRRSPCPPAGGEKMGIGDGCIHVERQHASFEILQEHGPCRCFEIEATALSGTIGSPDRISAWLTEVWRRRSAGCPAIQAATCGTAGVLIMADRMLVSRTNISQTRAVCAWLALRQLKVNASQRREAGTDALIEIAPRRTRCPRESRLKDTPGFGLHGVAVLRCADTQPLLDRRIEVADRDAAHRYRGFTCLYELIIIYDCVEINDSVAERRGAALRNRGSGPEKRVRILVAGRFQRWISTKKSALTCRSIAHDSMRRLARGAGNKETNGELSRSPDSLFAGIFQ